MNPLRARFLTIALLFLATPLFSQEPAQGHPNLPAFPGYSVEHAIIVDFDAADFQVAAESTQNAEGRSWTLGYHVNEGARTASPLELTRNYANLFKAKGGRIVFQEIDSGGGTATMSMPVGDGQRWLQLNINNSGEAYTMRVIETAEMKQKIEFTAADMAAELAAHGKVVLRGILFDTGKSDIKAESAPVLDEIARLLQSDSSLNLRIEGHTDDVGAKAANLALSKTRAAAVKTALVSRKIVAARLTTEGFGDSRPVGSNATAEGKAQNRRVELVKK